MDIWFLTRLIRSLLRPIFHYHDGPARQCRRPVLPLSGAEARATALLLRTLTPAQREEFEGHGYFTVEVSERGTFVVLPSTMFNVLHVATGDCYCAVPTVDVPLSDLMLSQKLLLENDPERFFQVANRRRELTAGLVDERLPPDQILRARTRPSRPRVRWSEISMLPYQNDSP